MNERRRTIRITRSGLLRNKLDDIDRPAIKLAETPEEIGKAFSLLHDVYLQMGYLSAKKDHGMLYGIHSLLPETAIFVAKSYLDVVSTLTEIFDSEFFGLPMDVIYQKELDALRSKGRRIVEISALVTPKEMRWRNLFLYLARVMYKYSTYRGVNDLCISVNPRHVHFYKNILLFDDLGPERHYPKVNAPAVALRVNMDDIEERMEDTYGELDFDCNLYAYFLQMTGQKPHGDEMTDCPTELHTSDGRGQLLSSEVVLPFFQQEKSLLEELTPDQRGFLNRVYPGLDCL
jgi:hypothetical protein